MFFEEKSFLARFFVEIRASPHVLFWRSERLRACLFGDKSVSARRSEFLCACFSKIRTSPRVLFGDQSVSARVVLKMRTRGLFVFDKSVYARFCFFFNRSVSTRVVFEMRASARVLVRLR